MYHTPDHYVLAVSGKFLESVLLDCFEGRTYIYHTPDHYVLAVSG